MTPIDVEAIVFIVVKAAVLIGLGLYTVFAIVLVRQEQLMAHVLEESFQPVLRLIVYMHLFASLFVFGAAFILL